MSNTQQTVTHKGTSRIGRDKKSSTKYPVEDYGQFGPVLASRKLGSGLGGFDTFKIKKTSGNIMDANASGLSNKSKKGRDTVRMPLNRKGISALRQDSIKSK